MKARLYASPNRRFYVVTALNGYLVVDRAGIIPLAGVHRSLRAAIARCDAAYRGAL